MMKRCVFISLLFLFSGCSALHTRVEYTTMFPPYYPETARYREIAVMPFDGPRVQGAADLIGRELAEVKINGRNVFTVRDYRKLKDISPEDYELMMRQFLDTDTYSSIGRMLGVKAVYTGEVTAASSDSDYDRSHVTECEQYDANNICIKEKKSIRRCKYSEGSLVFTIRLIDVHRSKVVFTGRFSGESNDEDCFDDDVTGQSKRRRLGGEVLYEIMDTLISGGPAAAEKERLDTAQLRAVQSFLRVVTPRSLRVRAELMDPGKDISSPEAREKISAGFEAARRNETAAACALFAEARQFEPVAPTLLFNLGVCEEAAGKPEAAQALYRRSMDLSGKNSALLNTALERVEEQIRHKDMFGL